MKKIIALMLALVLALSCCSALADGETVVDKSSTAKVTVNKYALAATVNDDLIFWNETGNTSTVITVGNGNDINGTRYIATEIHLTASNGKTKTIKIEDGDNKSSYEITAAVFKSLMGANDEYITVAVSTVGSYVTKNGISSEATEITEAQVLVMNQTLDPDTNLVISTTLVSTEKAYPGDKVTVTGRVNYQELASVLKGKATVEIYDISMYSDKSTVKLTTSEITTSGYVSTATCEFLITTDYVPGTEILFWTIGSVIVHE